MKQMKKLLIYIMVLTLAGNYALAYRHENAIKRTFTLNSGGTVRVKTIRGDINVSTHSGNEVKLEAIVFGENNADVDKMKIEFETAADSITIYTPADMNTVNVDIDYILKIPANVNTVQLSTLSGEIKVKGTYKHLISTSYNGDIDVEGGFSLCELNSANGEIQVWQDQSLSGDITTKSTNGSIKIKIGEESNFTVTGHTVTGDIHSEFNTGITGDMSGTQIKGTIKDGTYKINLETVNGDIQLLKQ